MDKELLYSQNERLVYKVYHDRYQNISRNVEDLLQCGRIGLWKACIKWDESKSQFATFAYRCILNEMRMFLRSQVKYEIRECDEQEFECGDEKKTLLDIASEEVDYSYIDVERFLQKTSNPGIWRKISQGESIRSIAKEYGVKDNVIQRKMAKDREFIKSSGLSI